ncbi:RagB/SusD family nutrient uptake outer membrane protein [Bacteroides ilei]|jgi:hypothetical protein|uniref:RagB/SusD family nutrient uptake outer membrane protein n=1 Tax=Bacteroides ilei TaxID=1907658 RepID=UPI00092FE02C
MKLRLFNTKTKTISAIGLTLLMVSSCSDILNEQPRSFYTPDYFQTERGIEGGITSMYAHLRYIYGQYYYAACEGGTDEMTYAAEADGNFKDADMSDVSNLNPSSCRADVLWGAAFSNINTVNGVLENGTAAGMDEALLAEARFFRGFDYFQLVQTFGGVPLDLGSGELKFNISTVRVSTRNTVPEVYTKAIFPDLIAAVEKLPEYPRITGGVTKNVARLFLSKAYLTYGWWLENPNNIPTYPECQRMDPDGHDAAWYFQQAYDIAVAAIQNPGPYGLMDSYYEVNAGQFDRNKEILLYADHTVNDAYYNGAPTTGSGTGGAPEFFCGWFPNWNYTILACATELENGKWVESSRITPIRRVAVQGYGRPWTRLCPTINIIRDVFTDKDKDSRYDGTFNTTYRTNWSTEKVEVPNGYVYGANNMEVREGEPILKFLFEDNPSINYAVAERNNAIGVGELPNLPYFVVGIEGISRRVFPGFWKWGPYRTDNGDGVGQPNAGNTRPYNIAKFSEFYFIAAEAAVKGANPTYMTARDLINVIRDRAGNWSFSNSENQEVNEDYSSYLTTQTPENITIDYILDERAREYFGEGYRWLDLVRTQKWEEKAGQYEICGNNYGDHTKQVITRTIEDYHYLRPIPQGQLDAMTMTEAEKDAYQNPGYE